MTGSGAPEVFGWAAAAYDGTGRSAHFGPWLVAAAGVAPGARVLHVATGRGAVLFAAAEQSLSNSRAGGGERPHLAPPRGKRAGEDV